MVDRSVVEGAIMDPEIVHSIPKVSLPCNQWEPQMYHPLVPCCPMYTSHKYLYTHNYFQLVQQNELENDIKRLVTLLRKHNLYKQKEFSNLNKISVASNSESYLRCCRICELCMKSFTQTLPSQSSIAESDCVLTSNNQSDTVLARSYRHSRENVFYENGNDIKTCSEISLSDSGKTNQNGVPQHQNACVIPFPDQSNNIYTNECNKSHCECLPPSDSKNNDPRMFTRENPPFCTSYFIPL